MGKRGPQLSSVADVAAFLAKVTREVYLDQISPKKAGTLGYLCNILKGCLETADLEARVEALEEQLEAQRSGKPVRLQALAVSEES
jgi:hypothetical protein